jgi:acyl carrier protein
MIEEEIKEVLAKQFGRAIDSFNIDDHLVDDLGADSLDLVEITMTLESKYKIAIDDDEADSANTVVKLASLILNKTAI